MSIENSVSNDFLSTFVNSINIFDCRQSGVNIIAEQDELNRQGRQVF